MRFRKKGYLLAILMLIVSFVGCDISDLDNNVNPQITAVDQKTADQVSSSGMKVHYIDVGQGDSELIQVDNKNMLIDAGTGESKEKLKKYLTDIGVTKLDYIVATHPHEDHIAGMPDIINNFTIGSFYSPKVTSNTKIYENMIDALQSKNLKINVLRGDKQTDIDLGTAKVEVYSPNEDSYEDLNNYSPIMKITYGETKFLFVGDAEVLVEKEVINKGSDIKANVLKVGHHGSDSSSSKAFLEKVKPDIAVIEVGKDNSYGHPKQNILDRYSKMGIKTYRTDQNGTIVVYSDGKTVTVK